MFRILDAKKRSSVFKRSFSRNSRSFCGGRVFDARRRGLRTHETNRKGSAKVNFMGMVFGFVFSVAFLGGLYLYQVNDLVKKGYEMKDAENKIRELKKENEKNKVKEVELRSMYNLEKVSKDFNLVSSNEVSFLERNSSVAMK